MKRIYLIFLLILIACTKDATLSDPIANVIISDCKTTTFKDIDPFEKIHAYVSEANELTIMHIDTKLKNCDEITLGNRISNDTIYQSENALSGCLLECFFDVTYNYKMLPYGMYIIKMNKYDLNHLTFVLNFTENTDTTFTVF